MRKVVVIGSNAFSGQDFIDLLLDDPSLTVIGVSRSPEKPGLFLRYHDRAGLSRYGFRQMDMNLDMAELLALLDAEKPDAIVNFAAQSEVGPSWEHPEHWFETNTVALAKLINHLRRQDYLEKYLHISSPEAYGSCAGKVMEDTPDNPSTPYAASKAAADMLLRTYAEEYGFPLVTVRATNVYGARQQLFKIIPRSIIYIKSSRTIPLHGGGGAVKSYIHVRDVSKAELAVLRDGEIGGRYHISPNAGVAVRDVVLMICDIMGVRFEEQTEMVNERPGQDAAYLIDSTKLRTTLGWEPEIGLQEGLEETIAWVEDSWHAIQGQELVYVHKP